jgi:3-dehydroquinate synthase
MALRNAVGLRQSEDIFLLTDENSRKFCLQEVSKTLTLRQEHILCLPAGEEHKNLRTVEQIWDFFIEQHATRNSMLLILGGGVLTDMGGFAASTFKRGIPYVNIPTTLLAMVDAANGGKTGFDYKGLKNEIGMFSMPVDTIVYPPFLKTLPHEQLLSGYAEMLKHALIASPLELIHVLALDIDNPDWETLSELIQRSIDIKQYIVEQDPNETGLRKSLNFGHTVGHALEEYSFKNSSTPLLHGFAVMYGIVAELYLSVVKLGLQQTTLTQVAHFMREHYGKPVCSCKDYDLLLDLMRLDKKNEKAGEISFALLRQVGNSRINQHCTDDEIRDALDCLFNQ